MLDDGREDLGPQPAEPTMRRLPTGAREKAEAEGSDGPPREASHPAPPGRAVPNRSPLPPAVTLGRKRLQPDAQSGHCSQVRVQAPFPSSHLCQTPLLHFCTHKGTWYYCPGFYPLGIESGGL